MKMLKPMALVLALSAIAAQTQAQPAVYRGGTLTIPAGVLVSENRKQYYADIVLETDSSGNLELVSANPLPKVMVNTVDAMVSEDIGTTTVVLSVAGDKSVPCTILQNAAVVREDAHFSVILAESVLGPAESCIAVLDPFTLDIPLDVSGLSAGTYTVDVNGVEVSFDLSVDAP